MADETAVAQSLSRLRTYDGSISELLWHYHRVGPVLLAGVVPTLFFAALLPEARVPLYFVTAAAILGMVYVLFNQSLSVARTWHMQKQFIDWERVDEVLKASRSDL
jgi:hypothetical protein